MSEKEFNDGRNEEEELSIVDILLDENNTDNLVLFNEQGEEKEFEQIAVIPYDSKVYVILRPVDFDELTDDEACVFALEPDGNDFTLDLVLEDDLLDAVFDIYNKAAEEGN